MAEEAKVYKVKKIAELRTLLEERVRKMEEELGQWRALLDFVNTTVLKKSFKRAEIMKPPPLLQASPQVGAEEVAPAEEQAIPLKTVTGDLLANLLVNEDSMRVVLAEDKQFDINTPPFRAFLLERVLVKMQEKDREEKISPDKIFSYNIVREGDIVREIEIRNIGFERSGELRSTIKWTLEKMYEKMTATA